MTLSAIPFYIKVLVLVKEGPTTAPINLRSLFTIQQEGSSIKRKTSKNAGIESLHARRLSSADASSSLSKSEIVYLERQSRLSANFKSRFCTLKRRLCTPIRAMDTSRKFGHINLCVTSTNNDHWIYNFQLLDKT